MKKILAVLTIASALLLTGCSQSNEAAIVGDFKITQTELQSSIDSVVAERTEVDTSQMQLETGEELNRGQLRFKILMHTFDEIAKELKIEVTSSEITAKKIVEISKEEKLARDRLKEIRVGICKKLKEIGNSGAFQS